MFTIDEPIVIAVTSLAALVSLIDCVRVWRVSRGLILQRICAATVYLGISTAFFFREQGWPWPGPLESDGGRNLIRTFIIALSLLGAAEIITRWEFKRGHR